MKTRASSSHDGPPWHDDERPATEAPPDENPDDFPFGDAWEPGDDSPEQERASEEPKEKRRQEQKQQQSRQQNGEDHQQERPPILCAPLTRRPISAIPPRPWAYGHFMLRGHVSMLAGRDGIGKGAQAAAMGVEFVTGRELLGEHIWITGPVCLISYEDDREEWERRIAGVCVHHGIDYERVIEQFHFLSRPGGGAIRFAAAGRHGIVFPDSQDIIAHLKGTRAALLIVDPFNRTHEVEDGNANAPISRVAGEIERVLAESDGATGLLLTT